MRLICCYCFVIFIFLLNFHNVVSQRRRKPKPTTRTKTTTLGGRWNPIVGGIYGSNVKPKKKKKPIKSRQPAAQPYIPRWQNPVVRSMVKPPIMQQKGRPLEDPPWTHCINQVQVTKDWVRIVSDGYPIPIHTQQQCTWMLYCKQGYKIRLSFSDVDLLKPNDGGGCKSQFVEIMDMFYSASQGKHCGESVPGDYVSKGTKLRLDIQRDLAVYPYRGFSAAVRIVPITTISGRYSTSALHIMATSKKVTPAPTTRKPIPIRRTSPKAPPTTLTTSRRPIARPPSNAAEFYGPNNQPVIPLFPTKKPATLSTMTTTLLIAGSIVFLLILFALAFLFRKLLMDMYQKLMSNDEEAERAARRRRRRRRRRRKQQLEDNEAYEEAYSASEAYSTNEENNKELPVSFQRFSAINDSCNRKRRSVTFEDEWVEDFVDKSSNKFSAYKGSTEYIESGLTTRTNSEMSLQQAESKEEPIYEMGDEEDWETSSVQSGDSVRTTSRHPDHKIFRQKKIYEKQLKTSTSTNSLEKKQPQISNISSQISKTHSSSDPQISASTSSMGEDSQHQQQLAAAMLMQDLLQAKAAASQANKTQEKVQPPQTIPNDTKLYGNLPSPELKKVYEDLAAKSVPVALLPVETEFLKKHKEKGGKA